MIPPEELRNSYPKVLAIIPAYNESQRIKDVVLKTIPHVSLVIVVDDGSIDDTSNIASSAGAKVIRNIRNMGKGVALKKGLIECLRHNPDIVVTLDGDGQHDPSDIPRLIKPIVNSEADIVIGSRYAGQTMTQIPIYRILGLAIINFMHRYVARMSVKDTQSGFRAYSKNVLSMISSFDSRGYGVESEQLSIAENQGYNIVEIPVTISYHGLQSTSKKNPVLHGAEVTSSILRIAVEKRPILFFGIPGVALLAAALATGLNLILLFNDTRYFSIPLSIITLGFTLSGILMIFVSLIFYALKEIRKRILDERMLNNEHDALREGVDSPK